MKSIQSRQLAGRGTRLAGLGLAAFVLALHTGAEVQAQERVLELSAASANVNRTGRPVRIELLRWSTDAERGAIVTAWNSGTSEPAMARAGEVTRAGGGGGGGGFAGRGRGRGDAQPEPVTPIEAVTTAIKAAPTLGYIWTDSAAGFSVKYAVRSSLQNGDERIILATDRRLNAYTEEWTPTVSAEPTDYETTLIELRLTGDGSGEGRTSLTTAVVLDDAAGALVLDDYAAAPILFDSVRR